MTRADRIIPTGTCWCGCERETALGAFFVQGHDKIAEAAVLDLHFGGSVAQLLQDNGYHPGNPVIKAAWRAEVWDACACGYHGRPASRAISSSMEGIRRTERRSESAARRVEGWQPTIPSQEPGSTAKPL